VTLLLAALTCSGCGPSVADNESRVVARLVSLVGAQDSFRLGNIVDQDSDGLGEYGWLGELAGQDEVRVQNLTMATSPYLPAAMGKKDAQGRVEFAGYYLRMFLPSKTGPAIGEVQGSTYKDLDFKPHPDADAQEARWACYAWPVERGVTGTRTFLVTQEGWVYGSDAAKTKYGGDTAPSAGAAFLAGDPAAADLGAPIARAGAKRTAVDGNIWTEVHGPIGRMADITSTRR